MSHPIRRLLALAAVPALAATAFAVAGSASPSGPSISFISPQDGGSAAVGADTLVRLSADGPNPITAVQLYAGEHQVCFLQAPPYSCTFKATPSQVGPMTLVAVATDSKRRNAVAIRTIHVPFGSVPPRAVTLAVSSRSHILQVAGQLLLPRSVTMRKQACTGAVTLTLQGRGQMRELASIDSTCHYSAQFRVTHPGRISVQAMFLGNAIMSLAWAPPQSAWVRSAG